MITLSIPEKKKLIDQNYKEVIDILQILTYEELINQKTYDKLLEKLKSQYDAVPTINDFNKNLLDSLEPANIPGGYSMASSQMQTGFAGIINVEGQKYQITLIKSR